MKAKSNATNKESLGYMNPDMGIEERVLDLLSQMTVEEKVAQMMGIWNERAETLLDENGDFDLEKAKISFKHGNGIGQIGRPNEVISGKNAAEVAEITNQIQKFL